MEDFDIKKRDQTSYMARKVEFYLFYTKVKYKCTEIKKNKPIFFIFKYIRKKELNGLSN